MRSGGRLGLITVLALMLAGCGTGTAPIGFPKGQSAELVNGALSALENHPFLSFTGEVGDFVDGKEASVSIGIAGSGLMYGTAKVGGADLKLLSVDGKYFVNAQKEFWDGHGDHDSDAAERLGGDWTPVDPRKWFDPGSVLATKEYVSALKATLRDVKTADSWRPAPTKKYGDRCHPFRVRSGTMCVSVDKPHRITYLDDVLVSYESGKSDRSATLDLELGDIDADAVESWAKKLRAAVKDLSTVYAYGGVSMMTSSDGFFCFGTMCTFTAYMGVEELPKYQSVAKKAKVGFKGVARTGSGKAETCTASVTVKVGGDSKAADCSVTFSLGPEDSQRVSAEWQSTGLMTYKPDTGELGEYAKEGIEKVLDEL